MKIEVNPVDRHLGKDVRELPATDVIRFYIDERNYFDVKMEADGNLQVRTGDRRLSVQPHASNVVYVSQVPW